MAGETLTPQQQVWDGIYRSIQTERQTNKTVIELLESIPVRTDQQQRSLETAQLAVIKAENQLNVLQSNIDAQLSAAERANDKRIGVLLGTGNNVYGAEFYNELQMRVADSTTLTQRHSELFSLASTWNPYIPNPGSTVFEIRGYQVSNNNAPPTPLGPFGLVLSARDAIRDFFNNTAISFKGSGDVPVDGTSLFNSIPPDLICKMNWNGAILLMGTIMTRGLNIHTLGKEYLSEVGVHVVMSVGDGACKILKPKSEIIDLLGALNGRIGKSIRPWPHGAAGFAHSPAPRPRCDGAQ